MVQTKTVKQFIFTTILFFCAPVIGAQTQFVAHGAILVEDNGIYVVAEVSENDTYYDKARVLVNGLELEYGFPYEVTTTTNTVSGELPIYYADLTQYITVGQAVTFEVYDAEGTLIYQHDNIVVKANEPTILHDFDTELTSDAEPRALFAENTQEIIEKNQDDRVPLELAKGYKKKIKHGGVSISFRIFEYNPYQITTPGTASVGVRFKRNAYSVAFVQGYTATGEAFFSWADKSFFRSKKRAAVFAIPPGATIAVGLGKISRHHSRLMYANYEPKRSQLTD